MHSCYQISNIVDPFSDYFPSKKALKPYLVSENAGLLREREVLLSPLSLSLSPSLSLSRSSLSLSLCASDMFSRVAALSV